MTMAPGSVKDSAVYAKATAAEKDGKPHAALQLLQSLRSSFPACEKLATDIQRLVDAMYGVKGSDGTISIWEDALLMSKVEPTQLQGSAWVQAGRKIYRHGGLDFINGGHVPSKDEMWEFDIDEMKWTYVKMAGANSPGPRSGHKIFVMKNDIYLWGGRDKSNYFCSKLYRLRGVIGRSGSSSAPLRWEVVKTSSQKPPGREEHAAVVYKGKYYITGGALGSTLKPTDDIWVLNLSSFKWSPLKSGPVRRHEHGMWAARDKLYVLGGRTHVQGDGGLMDFSNHSIEDFVSYDISMKKWNYEDIVGNERPHDLSEFTVLPIYTNDGDGDPSSVIIWGGYGECDMGKGPMKSVESLKARYGEEYKDFTISYRRRLLRFDVETNVWKNLRPTTEVLPKAQSFAAVLNCEKGVIRMLIGCGYGFNPEQMGPPPQLKAAHDELAQMIAERGCNMLESGGGCPRASNKIYAVAITESFGSLGGARDDWCWDLYNLPKDKRPQVVIDLSPFSSTFHNAVDITREDFLKPSSDLVLPNDQDNLLGVRVTLHNLKGRKDLNDQVGRCGCWLEKDQRYQVFLPFNQGGASASSVSVKPTNLQIASAVSQDHLHGIALDQADASMKKFPNTLMTIAVPSSTGKLERPVLDELLDPPSPGEVTAIFDTYYGPVSRKAQVILRKICQDSKSIMSCVLIPLREDHVVPSGQLEFKDKFTLYSNFVRQLRDEDSVRVQSFENNIATVDEAKVGDVCGKWMRLTVQLDGLTPPIQREILVSPEMTLRCLHEKVLCPAMNWKPNYHGYAFRKSDCVTMEQLPTLESSKFCDTLQTMEDQVWIGPKRSTALDNMFMPLYIGGCLANDKNVSIGQLFVLNKNDEEKMYLQYVHDFGDWWSHSICVSKYDGCDIPNNATVAHLISGKGGSVPDDSGGIVEYVKKISKLTGQAKPSSESWWSALEDLRGNSNRLGLLTNPLDFDVEKTRASIEAAIRTPTNKAGRENINSYSIDRKTGIPHEWNKKCTASLPKNKTKLCAVCGVTVALKLCSRCSGIAYCCRQHQLDHWGVHKSECKKIRKGKEGK